MEKQQPKGIWDILLKEARDGYFNPATMDPLSLLMNLGEHYTGLNLQPLRRLEEFREQKRREEERAMNNRMRRY